MLVLKSLCKKYKVTAKAGVEDAVNNMMADANFLRAIPEILSAAKSAIQVAHKQNKPGMVKFNALVIAYMNAMHKKDTPAAVAAAKALIKAGHGEAFGLN